MLQVESTSYQKAGLSASDTMFSKRFKCSSIDSLFIKQLLITYTNMSNLP